MSIYRDKATGRWRFEFDRRRVGGGRKRVRKLLPAGWTRAQAEAYDQKESAALHAIADGIAKPRRTVDEAVRCYVRERVPALKAGANTEREIDAMRDWWTGRAIEDLPEVCAEYAAAQHGALAPATIKNRISYLRAACRWAWKRHKMAETDPGARVVSPEVHNERHVPVSRRQMVALCRACRHRGVRALIRILYYSAMRVSEARRAERAPGVFILPDTKNGSPRNVPMHRMLYVAATVAMPPRSVIDYWWPLAREACGLAHVHLHDLRHAAISSMKNAGVPDSVAGAIAGHKSAASMGRYTHFDLGPLAAGVGKIGRRAA